MSDDALPSALAKAHIYNERLDTRLRQTGIVDSGLFQDFCAVQNDPNASSVGWLHAKLCVLLARVAAGEALSLYEPSTRAPRPIADAAELGEWANLHFPIARFRV